MDYNDDLEMTGVGAQNAIDQEIMAFDWPDDTALLADGILSQNEAAAMQPSDQDMQDARAWFASLDPAVFDETGAGQLSIESAGQTMLNELDSNYIYEAPPDVAIDAAASANINPTTVDELYDDENIQELAASFLAADYDARDFVPTYAGRVIKPMSRYKRKEKEDFSLMEALNNHHDIMIMLVSYLPMPAIISLYSIDKRFHFLLNSNYVAYVRAVLRTWAPGSEDIFPWTAYRSLCLRDPMSRSKSKWVGHEILAMQREERRDVPSLLWLQMCIYREGICKDILIQLALQGLYCPRGTSDALKRMWFMLDLPLNAYRVALVQSTSYMDSAALIRLTCFVIKLDMFFTRPDAPLFTPGHPDQRIVSNEWTRGTFVGGRMREFLLHERHLTPLWRVLHGWSPDPSDPQIPMTRLDVLRMWVRHCYMMPQDVPLPIQRMSIMGIPWWQVGTARYERCATPGRNPMARQELLRPDEFLMQEGIRRRLGLHQHWMSLMVFGIGDHVGRPMPRYTEAEMNEMILAQKR